MHICAAFIRQYWNKFQNISRRSKYTSLFVILIALVGVFLVPHIVRGADGPIGDFTDAIILALTRFFLWLAGFAIQLSLFFLKFFILLAGYNGFINASVVKFGWNIIRDVANMFFIVILLVIAFGTILGLEQYEWKKSLPKLVFAAIFVNFSNVICQLVIDVAQVFTITFLNAVAGTAGGNFINMMNFGSVLKLAANADATPDVQGDLIIGALFAMFMCFMAAMAIGSYLVVMLFRMVTLWCLIILSPLAFLFSVLPSTKSYADEFWKEFVNHVIAAPVMVFFLWLAFAVFGAGSVVDSLQGEGNNSLVGYKIDDDSNAVAGQTGVSVSEAASWMNMANFAVAIAFLMMGMERVSKLGVKGGDWVEKGKGFATRAFNIAAGIELSKMAHGAGKSALGKTAGFIGNKIPIIGGDSLKRYGKSIAGYTKMQSSRFRIVRDDKAVKAGEAISKRIPKILGGAIIGGLVTKGLQSNARADKIAHKWESAGEDAHKRWDEEVSTSKTAAGKAALTETRKLNFAVKMSEQKREQKFAEEDERLLKAKQVGGLSKAGLLAGTALGAASGWVGASKLGKLADKIGSGLKGAAVGTGGFLGRGANFISGANTFGGRGYIGAAADKAAELKARAVKKLRDGMTPDQQKEFDKQLAKQTEKSKWSKMSQLTATTGVEVGELHKHHEKHEAHEKDVAIGEVLLQQPRFAAQVEEQHQKALEEGSSGLNYVQAINQSKHYADQLAEAQAKVLAGDSSEKLKKTIQTLTQNLAASVTANSKQGRDQGTTSLNMAAKAAGWSDADDAAGEDDTPEITRDRSQRKLFTALTGQRVEAGEGNAQKAMESFIATNGSSAANAMFKQLNGAFKVAASSGTDPGALNLIALLDDREVDSHNQIKHKLTTTAERDPTAEELAEGKTGKQRDDSYFEGQRNFYAGLVSESVGRLKSIGDMVSRGPKGAMKIDAQSITQLSTALGSLTPQTRTNSGLIESLKKAHKEDKKGFDAFIKSFEQTHKTAAEALKFKLGMAVSEATKAAAKKDEGDQDDGSGI